MKVRKVCPERQREANEIMEMVANEMDISIRSIRSDSHHPDIVTARKYCVYFIRGKTMLQRDLVAQMVGYSQPHYVSKIFAEVYYRRRKCEKERTVLQRIEQLIFNK